MGIDFRFTVTQSGDHKSEYHFDEIMSCFAALKLYFILKLLPECTLMSGEKASKICEMNGFNPDYLFFVKVALKEHPFMFLSSLFLLLLLALGPSIQIFERGILTTSTKSGIPS